MKKLIVIVLIISGCYTGKKYISKPAKYVTYQQTDSEGRIYFITKKSNNGKN